MRKLNLLIFLGVFKLNINKWWLYAILLLIGTGILIGYWFVGKPSNNDINFLSLLGTYLEMYGITITFLEILDVKSSTKIIKETVENTKNKFQSILSLSDISKSTKTIDEIQAYLGTGMIQMAYLRMKDLRKIIIDSEISDVFSYLENQQEILSCKARVHSDINDMYSHIFKSSPIDHSLVAANLEQLTSILTSVEQTIKMKNV